MVLWSSHLMLSVLWEEFGWVQLNDENYDARMQSQGHNILVGSFLLLFIDFWLTVS